ncbi:ABC transporter substrate-binding protein [Roseibium sediminicola]|uniref:ABC transporter substrate-binding protein n=1 Tax=Roseibium sediminicola TaxID=2933272 RepID=A0ABT0GN21_9HYPH|nr:ABC transporter substrate-binding protein [Roseibium sp. CAU 1639]MCK7610819.1 ABC transporter substrate-binding protein [Roseibium sp. CAU 1639]
MSVMTMTRGFCLAIAASACLASAPSALAETITVTDLAGRTVEVEKDPSAIVLGEGRMIYSLALLDRDNPFERVVGWKDDMILYDPDAWRKYEEKFPEAKDIQRLGSPYSDEWNLEAVISSGTEVVFMNLGNLLKAQESGIIDKLEAAGVATVFVDFRQDPTQNTVPSIQLLGRILDERDKADAFTDYYTAQMKRIYAAVDKIPVEDRPVVFIERAAGYNPNKCCGTFGSANLGRLVELAGGRNWGSQKFPGFGGNVSLEAVFADDPAVIIGTGANWAEANPETTAVLFGYEAAEDAVQERLAALAEREGWPELQAVKSGRFHSIYHQFYNSPYHFVAMQAFAKWLHPELFEDLEPEATMVELHERFLPIDYSGVFWASLNKGS